MKNEKPLALPIKEIIIENERVKTFVIEGEMEFKPGQFTMCWIPSFDEKPFGLVSRKEGEFMITVAAVGTATKALHMMEVGDMLGFRGPFGSVFNLPKKGSIALIAGGYGMASLFNLAKEAREKKLDVHVFLGARNKNELLYLDWMKELGVELHLSTDDGSAGFKGFNVQVFEKEVGKQSFDKAYTVGPEIMEMKIAQICWQNNIPFEVSLERYMKCGFGICGQCCVDPVGWRMCVEGPVIDGEKLKQITEFGKYHRTASGRVEKYPWAKNG